MDGPLQALFDQSLDDLQVQIVYLIFAGDEVTDLVVLLVVIVYQIKRWARLIGLSEDGLDNIARLQTRLPEGVSSGTQIRNLFRVARPNWGLVTRAPPEPGRAEHQVRDQKKSQGESQNSVHGDGLLLCLWDQGAKSLSSRLAAKTQNYQKVMSGSVSWSQQNNSFINKREGSTPGGWIENSNCRVMQQPGLPKVVDLKLGLL